MTWLEEKITAWHALVAAASAALVGTWGFIMLLPKIKHRLLEAYRAANAFLTIDEKLDKLLLTGDRLDDRITNLIEIRRMMLDDHQDAAYFITDEHGKTLWVSKTWTNWTGIDNDQARGSGWELGIAPFDRNRVITAWEQAIDHERRFEENYSYVDRIGNTTAVTCTAGPVRRKGGTIMNFFGTARRVKSKTTSLAAAAPHE